MSTHDVSGTMTAPPSDDPDELRSQIEHTREELGETVAALSEKADVKAQASAKADEVKHRAQEASETAKAKVQSNPAPYAIGAVVLLLVLRKLRKRRRNKRNARLERLQLEAMKRLPVDAVVVDRSQMHAA